MSLADGILEVVSANGEGSLTSLTVRNVKTSLVLRNSKDEAMVPLELHREG